MLKFEKATVSLTINGSALSILDAIKELSVMGSTGNTTTTVEINESVEPIVIEPELDNSGIGGTSVKRKRRTKAELEAESSKAVRDAELALREAQHNEEFPEDEDEEDEAPVAPKKSKAPAPVEDEDEEDDDLPPPPPHRGSVRRP